MVKRLLATAKIDVDSKDNDGWTPLTYAAANGHDAVVKLLLATKKVDINAKDTTDDRTPLGWAAAKACSKEKYGQMPLGDRVFNGYGEIVKMLLAEEGFEVNPKDRKRGGRQ